MTQIITVFNQHINPDKILYIWQKQNGCDVFFSDEAYIPFAQTAVEVGNEINRILYQNKCAWYEDKLYMNNKNKGGL